VPLSANLVPLPLVIEGINAPQKYRSKVFAIRRWARQNQAKEPQSMPSINTTHLDPEQMFPLRVFKLFPGESCGVQARSNPKIFWDCFLVINELP
jgi:hypothetical protein